MYFCCYSASRYNLRHIILDVSNLLPQNPSKTEFALIGLSQQISKIIKPSLFLPSKPHIILTNSARNLGFIFDKNLTVSKQISSLSSARNNHIYDLRLITHALDKKTASSISASVFYYKLDYCNSLYLKLPKKQISRLQLLQNSLARTITGTLKTEHIFPILKSLNRLKIEERIHKKTISHTYEILNAAKPIIYVTSSTSNLMASLSYTNPFTHIYH